MKQMHQIFDLKHVETLLQLPCFIDSSYSLIRTAILATAKKVNKSEFIQDIMPEESLDDFLKRVYNGAEKYDMDCSIYAQLVINGLRMEVKLLYISVINFQDQNCGRIKYPKWDI